MATKAYDAKAYIFALATSTLTDIQVMDGFNGQDLERKNLIVGGIDWDVSEWGPFGNKARNEEFGISLTFGLVLPGGTNTEAQQAAYALYNALEDAIRTDSTLGGIAISCALKPEKSDAFPGDNGAVCVLSANVHVVTRI